jgi:hypothetical protein
MTSTATRADRIDAQLIEANKRIQEATEAHADASLALIDTPSDKNLRAQLEALEVEIAQYQRDSKRLAGALNQARARDTKEAKAAHAAAMAQKFAMVRRASAKRIAAAAEVDKAIKTLSAALKSYDEAGQSVRGDALALFREAQLDAKGERDFARANLVGRLASGNNPSAASALSQRMLESGLGRVGITADYIEFTPTRSTLTIEQTAELSHNELLAVFAHLGLEV